MNTTRTLNPLPFEHLEPKRFEDLARQLVYDFRTWRRLETTGRAGGDDGFDARGWEVIDDAPEEEPGDPATDETPSPKQQERLWLIQCKREKAIGPAKMRAYLDEIREEERKVLDGIIFVAACNLSKKTRDVLRDFAIENSIGEWHAWAISELEDMLFQPKNDHLLFAYFGLSLTIRLRTVRSAIRARLVMKRKARRILGDGNYLNKLALIRDPEDDRYPGEAGGGRRHSYRWFPRYVSGYAHNGVKIRMFRHFAYVADDDQHWDEITGFNDASPNQHWENPWINEEKARSLRQRALNLWQNLPEQNRAWLEGEAVLLYDDIIEIDDLGDDWCRGPHIYVPWENGEPRLLSGYYIKFTRTTGEPLHWAEENKIKLFPDELPEIPSVG